MKQFFTSMLIIVLIFCFSGELAANNPTAKIKIVGVSNDVKKLIPLFNSNSTGLPNVGVGEKVWLEAQALHGPTSWHYDTLTANAVWSLISKPVGSVLAAVTPLGGGFGDTAVFIPDVEGQYQLGLNVTTANGTKDTTVYINAARWVGVGNITGVPSPGVECGVACHTSQANTWKFTNHATAFKRKLDDGTGHFGSNCISCHSVGYNKDSTAVNNGFDDVATTLGWVFPTILQPGNFDTLVANYPALAKLSGIQCENCHGPGSQHSGLHDKNQMAMSLSADVCGSCHGAMTHHTKNFEWNNTAHANSFGESTNLQHMNSTSCAICHTAEGFVAERIGGKVSAAPYPDVHGITCAACHDPHDGSNPAQLRKSSIAEACTPCHTTRISSRGLHHSLQGPMLAGVNATPYDGVSQGVGNWSGWQLAGYTYKNSSHSDIAEKCVACHMAASPADSLVGKLGGHSFMVAYDDNGTTVLNSKGCEECHGEVSMEFVEQSQNKIKALLEQVRVLLPHATTGDTTQPKGFLDASLTKIQKAASYNYNFIINDVSYGVHNHDYATQLLVSSIEQLNLARGSAAIAAIKDVPNDQGKKVNVSWNKFPAENFSVDPLVTYQIFRKDAMGLAKGELPTVKSFTELIGKGKVGGSYVFGDVIWTSVGIVPAAKQVTYGFDAATIYDSTVSSGMKWTTFFIAGLSSNPYVVYSSQPDSGYSLDNLAPAAPVAVVASLSINGVQLQWNDPVDADVKFFSLYRGSTPGFVPTTPLAEITETQFLDNTVVQGGGYYYKVIATDFSGNKSTYSNEMHVTFVDVRNEGGIPSVFALSQNYPNPFNPTTEIKYQVPQASHVRITVFNTLGSEVARLVDNTQDAGFHSVIWDGKDNNGRVVSSGIYLYKMEAGSYTDTRKMILMK